MERFRGGRDSSVCRSVSANPFMRFPREEWASLRSDTPLSLSDQEIDSLRSVYERLSLVEVAEVYLPLSRFLNLHVKAAQSLGLLRDGFLHRPAMRSPFVIAIAGSVAAGKSTFARVLQAILARGPNHPSVELVTTDGFLYPLTLLEQRGLMKRKGFPESYDIRRLMNFLSAVKAGESQVEVPVYSHLIYDIVTEEQQTVRQPDILIVEGLNVLQTPQNATLVASDFFNFSVYIDAEEADLMQWYVERFLLLQRTAFQNPLSYFHRYRSLPEGEARQLASNIWQEINLVNLRENIQPTRQRADLVLRKQSDHSVKEVWLRQI
jgi:type I pantothenate kinase